MPWICLYTMQSSAKSLEFEVILSGRSLMNRRKSMGPSTDPWGTPLTTGILSDELPSTTTLWVRPDRNDAIQLCMLPRTPKCSSFRRRRWCGTLSKALEKSRTSMSVWIPLSSDELKSWHRVTSWVSQLLLARKPC